MTTAREDKTYNGWTNYETWDCALWMDNDEPSYLYWRQQAREYLAGAVAHDSFTKQERASLDLADCLKEAHEEAVPDLGASMYSDLMNAALGQINWYEIAQHLIEEVADDQ